MKKHLLWMLVAILACGRIIDARQVRIHEEIHEGKG